MASELARAVGKSARQVLSMSAWSGRSDRPAPIRGRGDAASRGRRTMRARRGLGREGLRKGAW